MSERERVLVLLEGSKKDGFINSNEDLKEANVNSEVEDVKEEKNLSITDEVKKDELQENNQEEKYDIDDFIKDLDNEEVMADVVPDKNEKSVAYEILMFIRDLAIMLVIFGLFTTFIADRTSVIGDSMEPNIHDGDYFVLNKVSYRFTEPERYDIVVFPYNHGQSNYIKRIIGLPGETIDFKKEGESFNIYINGNILKENYGKEPIKYEGNQSFPLVIPENEYFVMGDNRNDSSDSRYQDVGTIPRSEIIGKAGLRVWPLDDLGFVD